MSSLVESFRAAQSVIRRPDPAGLAPALAGGAPVMGHSFEFWRRPIDLLSRGREQLGDAWRFRLAGKEVTVLSGPKANKAFFHAPADVFSARECYQFTVPVFGRGVAYDVEPSVMDEQLGWVHPALSEKRLRTYAQIMVDEAEGYLERWGDKGEIDLFEVTQELTTFIATRCLLGAEVRRYLTTDFARLYHDLDGGMNLLAYFVPDVVPLPSFRKRDKAREDVGKLLAKVMADRRAETAGVEHEDFLQTLMEARYAGGAGLAGGAPADPPPIADDVIVGILLTLIFAGQHTSAVLAAWTGILLHQHPQYLGPVQREVDEVVPAGEVTIDSLRRLTVLERAIKEAERMRPPLVMLMRAVLKDHEYGGYKIPAGSLAMVSPAVSHRLPEVFKNPHAYDPDRYAPGREEDKKTLYTLIGFGGGKHRCIGMVFAYQQVKAIWSTILRHFELELCEADYRPNYTTFVVGPYQPCRVRYRRRERPPLSMGKSTNGKSSVEVTR